LVTVVVEMAVLASMIAMVVITSFELANMIIIFLTCSDICGQQRIGMTALLVSSKTWISLGTK